VAERRGVVVYGIGENSQQVFHILKHDSTVRIVGFLDDAVQRHGTEHLGSPVFGDFNGLDAARRAGANVAIVAIGDNEARARISGALRDLGWSFTSAIHPAAIIDSPAGIGDGCIIELGVCIHPEARIGNGVFLGGSSVIAHHSHVGDYSLIGGGVIFGGAARVGRRTLVGVGAVLQPHITIGDDVVIGIGSAVVKDVPDLSVAVGVPAKVIRQRQPSTIV
jgi:sugar O-acyltransferase (sialic acid O-acetyltransferase NeuD family)